MEEIIMIVKDVKYQKKKGFLYFMNKHIAWRPNDKIYFTVSLLYDDVNSEEINKRKDKIKLVMHDNRMIIFDFDSASLIDK